MKVDWKRLLPTMAISAILGAITAIPQMFSEMQMEKDIANGLANSDEFKDDIAHRIQAEETEEYETED